MGTDNQNNRSTAPTPEGLAQIIAQQTAIAKESFGIGVKAGAVSITLTDKQVAVLAKAIKQAVIASLKKHLGKLK
jgi:hypothetical protein